MPRYYTIYTTLETTLDDNFDSADLGSAVHGAHAFPRSRQENCVDDCNNDTEMFKYLPEYFHLTQLDDDDNICHNLSLVSRHGRHNLSFVSLDGFEFDNLDLDEQEPLTPSPLQRSIPLDSDIFETSVDFENMSHISLPEAQSILKPQMAKSSSSGFAVEHESITTNINSVSRPIKRPSSDLTPRSRRKRAARNMWSAEEDQRLRDAVKQFGVVLDWSNVAALVRTRTRSQCAQHWRKTLRPELAHVVKGTWSDEDDAMLRDVVTGLDSTRNINWEDIASEMKWRRSPKQCRERWQNFLDPSLKFGQWTEAEDAKLMSLFKQYGRKWAVIAKQLPGRTKERVMRRQEVILRGNV